jgi:ATP-dependent DNA ligase
MANFDILHSRTADHIAIGLAFGLLTFDGNDLRRQPLRDRKSAVRDPPSCSILSNLHRSVN